MAFLLRGLLSLLLGAAVGVGVYFLLHVEMVHEMVSEQFTLTDLRILVIAGVVAIVVGVDVSCHCFPEATAAPRNESPLGMFLHGFDRGVEKVTGGYAAILSRIITRRVMTIGVGGFVCVRHSCISTACYRPASFRWKTRE